jgi:hypothetical protein
MDDDDDRKQGPASQPYFWGVTMKHIVILEPNPEEQLNQDVFRDMISNTSVYKQDQYTRNWNVPGVGVQNSHPTNKN